MGQTAETYIDPLQAVAPVMEQVVDPGSGEQISERLAQLQNQYDQEVASAAWQPEEVAVSAAPIAAPDMQAPQAGYVEPQVPMPEHFQQSEAFQQPLTAQIDQHQPQTPSGLQVEAPQMEMQQQAADPYAAYSPPPAQPPQAQAQAGFDPQAQFNAQQQQQAPQPDYYPDHAALAGQQEQTPQPHEFAAQQHQPIAHEDPEPSGGGMKKMIMGGAVAVALAAGGGGAYTYKYTDVFSGGATGPTPVVRAGGSPVKVMRPGRKQSGASLGGSMRKRLSGGGDPVADRLASVEASLGNKAKAASNGMLPGRILPRRANAPRRVKTLIVRPDGTILQPAGTEEAAMEAASKSMMSPGINAEALNRARNSLGTQAGAQAAGGLRRVKTFGGSSVAKRLGGEAQRATTQRVKRSLNMTGGRLRPNKVTPNNMRTVRAQPRRAITPSSVRSAGGVPYLVQVTSRSSQTSALAAFADMQQKYPSLIGAYEPDIQRADLGAKGVWYRLRVGPVASKSAAAQLCENLKSAGHPGCFVRRKK